MSLLYEEFKTAVRQICARPEAPGRLVAIPKLRRELADDIERAEFDRHVIQLYRDGLVHLLSHVDPDSLLEAERGDCLQRSSTLLAYWLHWL